MARHRRPSIPLIIIFIILLLLFFFAGTLVELVSNLTVQVTITYSYVEGNDPIVSITYYLPQEIADALAPKQPAGWTVNLSGNVLSLTGGTLNPGESVTVDCRLSKYVSSGTRTVTATSTTSTGVTNTYQTGLTIEDTFLLDLMWALYQNSIWLLILALIVLAITILLFIIGKKKDKEEERRGNLPPQHNPPLFLFGGRWI
jgi:cbb3-type cytochrome oxidase subunit 3